MRGKSWYHGPYNFMQRSPPPAHLSTSPLAPGPRPSRRMQRTANTLGVEESSFSVMGRFAASLLVLAVLSLEVSSFVFPVAPATGTSARSASAHGTRGCQAVSHRTAGRGVVLQSTTDKVGWICRYFVSGLCASLGSSMFFGQV